MGVFNRTFGRHDHHTAADTSAIYDDDKPQESVVDADESQHVGSDSDNLSLEALNEKEVQTHPNQVTSNAQEGVKKAEAAALVWSKKVVYLTYAWIWFCFFMLSLQQTVLNNVTFAAFSIFSNAPAFTTASILANIIGGVLKLPIAKTLNIWGRAEGHVVFVGVYVLGMVILAAAETPNTYAAGYVLYWIGYDAIYVILDIFIADTSGLRNRAFTWAFASTPFICTTFTGPLLAAAFLKHSTWHWAIGAFAIIQPFVFLPLAAVFKFYQKKAERLGLFKREDHGRTTMQSIVHYFHEFDVIGAIILMAAFVLFLLPFSLQSYGRAAYGSATFIALIVVGACLFPVFYVWERYLAPTQFLNWKLLRERTVLGACVCAAAYFFGFYCWNSQYYNFVKVVYNLDVTYTGYMYNIYDVGSTFWGVVFGVWVRYTKHFKHTCLFFGVPLLLLGSGLMIYFRSNDHGIGYIIMCQIFLAFGGGTIVIGEEMAVMASADREGVPMMLAFIYLSSSIGGAIGDAVSITVYSNTFARALSKALPASDQHLVSKLYSVGWTVQQTYAPGTTIRNAIDYAWGRTQFYECVAAISALSLLIPSVAVWKNYNVDKKQVKGTVI